MISQELQDTTCFFLHRLNQETFPTLRLEMFEFHLDFEMTNRNYQMGVSQTLCAKTASVMNLLVMMGTIFFGTTVSNSKDGFLYFLFVVATMQ